MSDQPYDPFKDPAKLTETAAILRRALARRDQRLAAEAAREQAS